MKNWLLLTSLCLVSVLNYAQTKRALVIVLEQYDPNEWTTIHSSNDTLLLKPALIMQGFKPSNITIINDKKGKKAQLLAAISQFARTCKKNDIVYFHYSGHGQSVEDYSKDETDGYDEAIVPIDAPATFQENGYHGELHIIDDTLDSIFTRIRDSIGDRGDLLITIDACYSGTVSRLTGFSRGNATPIASAQHMQLYPVGTLPAKKIMALKKEDRAVVFSACTAYQEDREYNYNGEMYGPLSFAIAECINKLPKGSSYYDLFALLKSKMATIAKEQDPIMEGKGSKLVLNGTIIPLVRSFLPSSYEASGQLYRMNYGQLQGFFEKTKVAVYDITTTNFESTTPITTGEVITSDPSSCAIKVAKNMNPYDPKNKKIVITEQSFGPVTIPVRLDVQGNPSLLNAIQQKLTEFPSVVQVNSDGAAELVFESNNRFLTVQGRPNNYLQISDGKGQSLQSYMLTQSSLDLQLDSLVKVVIDFMFGNYLKQLQATSAVHKSEFNLVLGEPCSENNDGSVTFKEIPKADYVRGDGNYVSKEGRCFRLELKNKGTRMFYYTVLLINPKNEVCILVPSDDESAAQKSLGSAKTTVLEPAPSVFVVNPPFGKDIYKLLVTSKPLELQMLLTSGVKNIPLTGETNPLYELLRAVGMGVKAPPPPRGDLDIKTFVLEVTQP